MYYLQQKEVPKYIFDFPLDNWKIKVKVVYISSLSSYKNYFTGETTEVVNVTLQDCYDNSKIEACIYSPRIKNTSTL